MLMKFCGVKDTPIEVLPNGVPDSLFDTPPMSYQARIDKGSYDFVLAARLMSDKLSQVDGLVSLISSLLRSRKIPRATVHLMGGGPSKEHFLARLGAFVCENPRVELNYHGWVSPEEVVDQLRSAIFSVAGGVTGTQSIAVGTPCLGAGARGICGASTPANIDRILGSNFGDHSALTNMPPKRSSATASGYANPRTSRPSRNTTSHWCAKNGPTAPSLNSRSDSYPRSCLADLVPAALRFRAERFLSSLGSRSCVTHSETWFTRTTPSTLSRISETCPRFAEKPEVGFRFFTTRPPWLLDACATFLRPEGASLTGGVG